MWSSAAPDTRVLPGQIRFHHWGSEQFISEPETGMERGGGALQFSLLKQNECGMGGRIITHNVVWGGDIGYVRMFACVKKTENQT